MSDNLNHITGFQCGDTILAAHNVLNMAAVRVHGGAELLLIEGERLAIPAGFIHATQQVINICHYGPRKGRTVMRELATAIRNAHAADKLKAAHATEPHPGLSVIALRQAAVWWRSAGAPHGTPAECDAIAARYEAAAAAKEREANGA